MQGANTDMIQQVAELRAKMDIMISSVSDLRDIININYPPRQEIDQRFERQGERIGRAESRIRDLEQAGRGMFFRWAPILISVVGTGTAVVVAFSK